VTRTLVCLLLLCGGWLRAQADRPLFIFLLDASTSMNGSYERAGFWEKARGIRPENTRRIRLKRYVDRYLDYLEESTFIEPRVVLIKFNRAVTTIADVTIVNTTRAEQIQELRNAIQDLYGQRIPATPANNATSLYASLFKGLSDYEEAMPPNKERLVFLALFTDGENNVRGVSFEQFRKKKEAVFLKYPGIRSRFTAALIGGDVDEDLMQCLNDNGVGVEVNIPEPVFPLILHPTPVTLELAHFSVHQSQRIAIRFDQDVTGYFLESSVVGLGGVEVSPKEIKIRQSDQVLTFTGISGKEKDGGALVLSLKALPQATKKRKMDQPLKLPILFRSIPSPRISFLNVPDGRLALFRDQEWTVGVQVDETCSKVVWNIEGEEREGLRQKLKFATLGDRTVTITAHSRHQGVRPSQAKLQVRVLDFGVEILPLGRPVVWTGQEVPIQCRVIGDVQGVQVEWSVDEQVEKGQTGSTFNAQFAVAGKHDVSVNVSAPRGAASGSDSLQVAVHQKPSLVIESPATQREYDTTDSIQLRLRDVSPLLTNIVWRVGDRKFSGAEADCRIASPSQNIRVSVSATDTLGSGESYEASTTINVVPHPELKITSPRENERFVLEEGTADVTFTIANPEAFRDVSWSFPAPVEGEESGGSVTHTFTGPAPEYVATVTGVTQTGKKLHARVTLHVNEKVDLLIEEPVNNSRFFVGESVAFRIATPKHFKNVKWTFKQGGTVFDTRDGKALAYVFAKPAKDVVVEVRGELDPDRPGPAPEPDAVRIADVVMPKVFVHRPEHDETLLIVMRKMGEEQQGVRLLPKAATKGHFDRFEWEISPKTGVTGNSSDGYLFSQPGDYTAKVTAFATVGTRQISAEAQADFHVRFPDFPYRILIAEAPPYRYKKDLTFTIAGGTLPGNVVWSFGDGTASKDTAGAEVGHAFERHGTLTVVAAFAGPNGQSRTCTISVPVVHRPPMLDPRVIANDRERNYINVPIPLWKRFNGQTPLSCQDLSVVLKDRCLEKGEADLVAHEWAFRGPGQADFGSLGTAGDSRTVNQLGEYLFRLEVTGASDALGNSRTLRRSTILVVARRPDWLLRTLVIVVACGLSLFFIFYFWFNEPLRWLVRYNKVADLPEFDRTAFDNAVKKGGRAPEKYVDGFLDAEGWQVQESVNTVRVRGYWSRKSRANMPFLKRSAPIYWREYVLGPKHDNCCGDNGCGGCQWWGSGEPGTEVALVVKRLRKAGGEIDAENIGGDPTGWRTIGSSKDKFRNYRLIISNIRQKSADCRYWAFSLDKRSKPANTAEVMKLLLSLMMVWGVAWWLVTLL
jgi:hypothetical protein